MTPSGIETATLEMTVPNKNDVNGASSWRITIETIIIITIIIIIIIIF